MCKNIWKHATAEIKDIYNTKVMHLKKNGKMQESKIEKTSILIWNNTGINLSDKLVIKMGFLTSRLRWHQLFCSIDFEGSNHHRRSHIRICCHCNLGEASNSKVIVRKVWFRKGINRGFQYIFGVGNMRHWIFT